jgi:hypothetical protein
MTNRDPGFQMGTDGGRAAKPCAKLANNLFGIECPENHLPTNI